jgi:outer membrane protein assembly factor BamB
MLYGFDAAAKKLLWEKNLLGTSIPTAHHILPDGDGGYRAYFADGRVQTVGRIAAVTPSCVCVQTHDGLLALDPLRAEVLWTRSDFPEDAQWFGDGKHLFYVRTGADGQAAESFALRLADGSSVVVRDFTEAFERRLQGPHLLVADDDDEILTLKQLDPLTGDVLWQQRFSANAKLLRADDSHLIGVVEPTAQGKVTVFDARDHSVVFTAHLEPRDLEDVADIHLLHDRERFYVVLNVPLRGEAKFARGPLPGLAGAPALAVNGAVYAFERSGGRLQWRTRIAHQLLLKNQFADLPMLLCVARYVHQPGASPQQSTSVQSFDKRTGKPVHEEIVSGTVFHSLYVRPGERRVELVGLAARIAFQME